MIRSIVKFLIGGACFLGMLVGSTAYAQDWANKMFDHAEHDFGILARGAKVEHRFSITNIFKEDLEIASIHSSCGCTDPKVTKRLLKSGETADLVAEFDTIKFKGQHSATITVNFAPPYNAEVRLQVHGYVRQDVVFQPGRVEFGQVPANEGASQQVSITYAGRDDWQISDVRSANANFEVELLPAVRSNGRVEYSMVVHLKKDTPTGYIYDQLTLVTNDDARRLIPLAVVANVAATISVSPASLHLGVVRSGESVTKQLVVRGTSPFRIVQVACEGHDEDFTFSPGNKQRKLHLVPVTFTAGDVPGKITEKIRITTEGDTDEELEVTAHVEVLGN